MVRRPQWRSTAPGEASSARRERKTGDLPSEEGDDDLTVSAGARRIAARACEGGASPELGGAGASGGVGVGEPLLLGMTVADEILRGGAVEASCWRMNVFCVWDP
jgi:hypothetical protein